MRTSLTLAQNYVAKHPDRFIFPIKTGAKTPPLIQDNLKNASNDPAQIEAWHSKSPGCNWGLALAQSDMLVVDVDMKAGKHGKATFDELNLLYGFPETETASTPSGGRHLYYKGKHIFALGTNGFGRDIDSPNYILIPGCELMDSVTGLTTHYKLVSDVQVSPAPQWFYDLLGAPRERGESADAVAVVDLDQDDNIARMIDYLKEGAPCAIEGQGGDMTTVKVAMKLRDEGVSRDMAKQLMCEHYNVPGTCDPLWDETELEKKVDNAYDYASLNKPGEKTAEAEFASDPLPSNEPTPDPFADAAAADRKTRDAAAKTEVAKIVQNIPTRLELARDWVYIEQQEQFMRRSNGETLSVRAFDRAFANVLAGVKLSDAMLKPKKGGCRKFFSYDYRPGLGEFDVPGRYNLWRPSDITPSVGDTTLWDQHLEYLFPDDVERGHALNWLAWVYQNQVRKPKHMLVIQGETQGTGKSFVADVFRQLIGARNTVQLRDQLTTSNFNGWAKQAKLVVIEEVRQAGRTGVARALHDMITQESLTINEKNVPHYSITDCIAYIGFSNKADALAMDDSDRRYLIVKTDASKRDVPYYETLFRDVLGNPVALAAIAASLAARDIGDYNAAAPAPFTSAKAAMIEEGRDDLARWIIDERGNAPWSWPLISINRDVIEAHVLPPHVTRGQHGSGFARRLAAILRDYVGGEDVSDLQHRLPDGTRVRLMALNGKAAMMRGITAQERVAIYLKQRTAGSQAAAASDFEGADDAEQDPGA